MTARIYVLGFVQGVGFRQFIKKNALNLKLTGTVQNLPDTRVEIVVQGTKEDIEKLIKITEKGPFFSDVKSVQVEWDEEKEKFKNFQILH